MTNAYDVIILGAGPGGYVAAIRAAQLGLNTAIVEAKHLGGVCLNWGCIPTKALLKSAEVLTMAKHAQDYGVRCASVDFDLAAMVKRSRDISGQLTTGIKFLLKKNKVQHIEGWATLKGKKEDQQLISVDTEKGTQDLLAPKIILATGAHARKLEGFEVNGTSIWDASHAMTPKSLPKTLLVLGSGAIGVEFASFYNALGVDVTLVELQDRILPVEDQDISSMAQKAFETQGIGIFTNTQVQCMKVTPTSVDVEIKTPKETLKKTFDVVLPAVGIVGNTQGYGLENTAIQVDRGHIVTNGLCETHEPGIYAIGDVTAPPWLAHKASHEGIHVAERMAGHCVPPLDPKMIPGCTYSMPQIASLGLTEAQIKDQQIPYKVGRFPFQGNGKALAMGVPEGLIKTLFHEKTGELLGAHMIGHEVTELIHSFALGKSAELVEEDFIYAVFPHPTLSEMLHESVLSALGQPIHTL